MNLPKRHIQFTYPQMAFIHSQHKQASLEWGRGGGKSTVLGWRIKEIVNAMPRSKSAIVGSTYTQLLQRTLPSTIEGLELLGFKKDLHYFVGRRPPKEFRFPEAYQPPLTYDNYITFYNGAGFQFISLENSDSGRGLNLDAIIGDEAALFDEEKLAYNVLLSNRGNIHRFGHTWLHHSVLFASTTPVSSTGDGKWFIKLEEEARRDPKNILHMVADSRYNFHNLGAEYFKTLKRKLLPVQYNAEVLCIRPGAVQNGFYPAFSSAIHTYHSSNDNYLFSLNYDVDKLTDQHSRFDADIITHQPIDIAMDYGSKINTLVCGQQNGNVYRVPKAMHVKTPQKVTDLAEDFCKYFRFHNKKEVNYYYDHTAHYTDPVRTTTYADEVRKILERNGWTVNMIYCGQAPAHHTKYLMLQQLMAETEGNMPMLRINKYNAQHLIISIEQAGAYDGPKGVQKDKRPERRQNAIDEETTHYSDALDTLLFFKFRDGLAGDSFFVHAVA